MRQPTRPGLLVAGLLLFGLAATLLAGCELLPAQPTPSPGAPDDTPGPTAGPTVLPTDAAEATPSAPLTTTLTIWTTETLSPTQVITSGQILAQVVAEFEAAHPDVRIQFILKKPYGKGGILDYLLSTAAVVPALLPDLALLDVDELVAAAQAAVILPLDDLIAPDLVSDLYPFARQACAIDGRLYGLQFQADLDHLVYNTGRLTVPPRSWPGVLSNPGPYIFPAGGQAGLVNDDFLIQYLAVRAWPTEENVNEPFLEAASLTAVLQFYKDGISRGVFPAEILNYQFNDTCWRDYLAGKAMIAHVSAHRFLAEREQATNSAIAPIPTINGAGAAISRGWAMTLVTPDPARQALAVDFMTRFMSPQTNAAWNWSTSHLPTRQAALAEWDEEDSFTRFTRQQLEAARPRPRLSNYTQVAAALQEAVEDVITGSATPEEAAVQAIEKAQ
jgi:multiple sugar transport system substrate-binding protein